MSIPKLLRVAVGVAALVPFATCTDFTGPTKPGVRVPIVPTFSKSATFAKAVYAAAGIEFNQVRVLIVRNDTEVLKDTTVAFSPSSEELTLPLVITANPGEVVTATLEYRNADIVLYSGTQSVTTIATGATPTTPPTPLILLPVGPGSSASAVQISPASGTFPTAASIPFTATAFASDNAPIANAIFGWEVNDVTIATVNGQGVVQPTSKGGVAKVKATTLNGKFAEATITFVTPPASLAIHSGGGQSAMALDALAAPVVVKVLDANGVPVPGATVNFAVATGAGSLVVVNGVSNASGLVSVNWTLGATVGNQSITATAVALPNNPITINATATERPAKNLVIGQQPLKSLMGASITPAVTVKAFDDKGHIVAGYTGAITIALDANPTGATLGGTLTVNAVAGVATFSNLAINKAGEGYSLKATATGLTAAVTDAFGVDQVPAGLSLNAGGNQTKAIKSVLEQVIVKVADANGIGVAGVTVTFEVVSGGGSIVVNNGTTDAEGLARVTWTLGTLVGEQSIKATAGALNGSPLTIKATGTALPAIALAFEVQPSTTPVGGAIAPAVKVKAINEDGGTVTGFTGDVALTLENANGATLGGTTSVAAVNGVATFSNLSVDKVGSGFKLSATSGSLTAALSSAFITTPGAPAALVFLVHPSDVVVGNAVTPAVSVKIVDSFGNLVSVNSTVFLERENPLLDIALSGTMAEAVNGVATFPSLTIGTVFSGLKLKATSSGLTSGLSNAFNVNAAPSPVATWTGAISTDWLEAGNWSPAAIPELDDSVVVVPAVNQPVIDSVAKTRVVLIETGATLHMNSSYHLQADSIYNRGTLRLTNATILRTLSPVTFTGIENRGTLLVDGDASVGPIGNVGAGSVLRIKADDVYYSGAYLSSKAITNEGTIELDDMNEGWAELDARTDSIVNRSGASILVKNGAGGYRYIGGTMRNYGTITVASTNGLDWYHEATAPNVNAGSFSFTGGGYFYQDFPDSTTLFTNTGTMSLGATEWNATNGNFRLKTGSVTGSGFFGAFDAQLDIDFSKFTGITLSLNADTRFAGDTINVPPGQTLRLTDAVFTQKVSVGGTVRITPEWGPTAFNGGAAVRSGGLIESNWHTTVNTSFAIAASGKLTLNANSGYFDFDVNQPFTNNGTIELTSSNAAHVPSLLVSGALTNANGATIYVAGGDGGERRIHTQFNNSGTLIVEHDSHLTLVSGGTVTNNSTGTIDLGNAGAGSSDFNMKSLTLEAYESAMTFNNAGTINVGANRTFVVGFSNTVANTGTGVIAGKGTIDQTAVGSNFTNSGTIKPGGAGVVGTMLYKGAFNIGTGTVEIDVASMVSGDQMQATLSATLGKVRVVELAGFQAGAGNIKAISAGSNGFTCSGTLTIEPAGVWSGYNDGCVYVYPIILFGPPKPPVQ